MTHTLKCWPEYFKVTVEGSKFWELRKFDRPFAIGDTVILQEYDPKRELFTGKEIPMTIDYILHSVPIFGIMDGFCILSLKDKESNY